MSRQIVRLQKGGSQQPDGHPGPQYEPPVIGVGEEVPGHRDDERGVLHIGRARCGHETEEDEDEELAEAEIPVRSGASRVGPPRDAADEAERDEPPGDAGRQPQACQSSDTEGDQRGDLDLADGRQLACHQPDGADPVLVRPAYPVRIVVDEVGADLDAQSHDQRQNGVQPGQLAVERCAHRCMADAGDLRRGDDEVSTREVARRRPDDDRDDRSRKGARARARHPQLERRAHGRRGKREKSGARCSTKAFRPSCPSSVM